MIFGSVCSGIEAASVAWHPLGWKAAWLAEIDPFPAAVLAHHYPDVPNLGDMTKIAKQILTGAVEAPDVLVGGTPCQAFSVAGMREGLADERGQLTIKYVELADAIDLVRQRAGEPPAIDVWENVPGVLSSKDNAFGCFLAALAGEDEEIHPPGKKWENAGCVFGPARTVAWRVLDAQYFGVAQRRRRVFVVASARKDFDPTAVLFEFDGMRRDTAPSRGAGQEAAAGTLRSTQGGSDVDHARAGHIQPVMCMAHGQGGAEIATERSPTLTCNHEAPIAFQPQCVTGDITHTLKAEGFDASEDGTGRGQSIVPVLSVHGTQDPDVRVEHAHTLGRNNGQENAVLAFSCKDYGADAGELSPTLRAMGHSGSHPNAGGQVAVAYPLQASAQHGVAYALQDTSGRDKAQNGKGWSDDGVSYTLDAAATQGVAYSVALRGREGGATAELGDDLAGCLRASSGGGDKAHVLATTVREVAQTLTSNYGKQPDNSDTALGPNVAIQGMAVRRLTPTECERLQGFPDGYTQVPYRNKPAADGPRYKALGNSMAVPCMAFIGRRIVSQLKAKAAREAA